LFLQYGKTVYEDFTFPKIDDDCDINWYSSNSLLEIVETENGFEARIDFENSIVMTRVEITLEIVVGKEKATREFYVTIPRCLTEGERNYQFTLLTDNTIKIIKYIGTTTNDTLIIPDELYYSDGNNNGTYRKVSWIGPNAFSNNVCKNNSVKHIVIPNTITIIDIEAFADNEHLETITFEEGSLLKGIGNKAFYNCKNIKTFTIPSNVNKIGEQAFFGSGISNIIGNKNFTWENEMLIQNNVSDKTNRVALYANPQLIDVVVPENVAILDSFIFFNNSNIKTINLTNVTHIGSYVFTGSSIEEITHFSNVESVEYESLKDTPWILKQEGSIVVGKTLLKYLGTEEHVVIEDGITTIASEAFKDNDSVKSVVLPNGIKNINKEAFIECSNLEWILINECNSLLMVDSSCFDSDVIIYVNALYINRILNNITFKFLPNEIKTKTVNVTFYDYNNVILGVKEEIYNSTFDQFIEGPEREGHKFVCWVDKDGNIYEIRNLFPSYLDVNLYPKYDKIVN
jgi:hypothetical protein